MRLSGASAAEADYQLDLRTPGSFPALAYSRKQMRHKPKWRINDLLRPQRQQRFTLRVENFGLRFDLAICDSVAINYFLLSLVSF